MRSRSITVLPALFAALAALPQAGAQSYPTKPIRVIIPYAGGAMDASLRVFTPLMEKDLGQPLVFDHRTGAGGTVGQAATARSAPDGYTILATTANPWVITPAVKKVMPYDPIKDFTPITIISVFSELIVATKSFPADTLAELIDYVKRNPGKISYATSGVGGGQHLAAEMLSRRAGLDMIHVTYQGMGPVVTAMLGGHVPLTVIVLQVVKPGVDAGKLKYIASTDRVRSATLPAGVPLVSETLPGFEGMPNWLAFAAPAGLPRPILQRLYEAAVKAMKTPEVETRYSAEFGATIVGNTPEDFAARVKSDFDTVLKAVKAAGIALQD